MIKVKNLSVRLDQFKFKNITFGIERNQYFVLLGPSGTGKTLLVECLAGLHKPHKGHLWINGQEATSMSPEKRGISYVPQDYGLFPHLTVEENIFFGLRFQGLEKKEKEKRVKNISQILAIESLLGRNPGTLSGGERQRVALARALVIQPRLLLLDEPLAALDAQIKQQLWLELKEIKEKLSLTVLHVTHDFEEACVLGERIGVLMEGELQQIGSPQEVLYHPKNSQIAQFMGIRNILEGEVITYQDKTREIEILVSGTRIVAYGSPRKIGERVKFCIRPEEVMIIRPDRPLKGRVRENVFSGEIISASSRGTLYHLYFRMDELEKVERVERGKDWGQVSSLEIRLPSHAYHRLKLNQNPRVKVSLKKKSIHLFSEEI